MATDTSHNGKSVASHQRMTPTTKTDKDGTVNSVTVTAQLSSKGVSKHDINSVEVQSSGSILSFFLVLAVLGFEERCSTQGA